MAACPWELMLLGVSWKLLGAVLLVQQGLLMSITALLPDLLHASTSAGVPLELLFPPVLPEGGRICWGAASWVGSEGPGFLSSAAKMYRALGCRHGVGESWPSSVRGSYVKGGIKAPLGRGQDLPIWTYGGC